MLVAPHLTLLARSPIVNTANARQLSSYTKHTQLNRPRVIVNGCWDLMHTGHYNALRQTKEISPPNSIVVAGIHSNSEIKRVKGGAFVASDSEKANMLSACKYVDEIIENVPYTTMTPALLDKLGVDFAAHGDDMPILPDGTKMYGPAEEAGRYLIFKRSEGISTTNLLNRLLQATVTHDTPLETPRNNLNNFILSSQRLALFSNYPNKRIENAKNIVYIDGDFDFFHMGHVEVLKRAKALGDFLVVGLHSDIDIQTYRARLLNLGVSTPQMFSVMSVGERAINLLSCKYVDDVILDAPLVPTADFFGALSIKKVCVVDNHVDFLNDLGRVKVARDWGMLEIIKVENDLFSTKSLLFRFLSARDEFVRRNHIKKDPTLCPVVGFQ